MTMDPMDAALEAIAEYADQGSWHAARCFNLVSAIPHRSTWERNLAEFGVDNAGVGIDVVQQDRATRTWQEEPTR